MQAIHGLLVPSARIKELASKKIWKISILDAVESVIIKVESVTGIRDIIQRKKHKLALYGKTVQPLMIVHMKQYIIIFDSIYFNFDNISKAIDCLFKIFQVFSLEYPIESRNFWQFIQQFFYEIPNKESNLQLNDLIKYLNS